MNYNPKINLDRFEASFKAIDAHTAGEFCRVVYSGFPKPEGNTPIERKHWLEKNYNHYRTALMLEPRGTTTCSAPSSASLSILRLTSQYSSSTPADGSICAATAP